MKKWIELVRVRSSAAALASAMERLREQVEAIEASVEDAEPFFLQHALYDGDLAVVVIWRRDCPPQKTREGLLIADTLSQLGSIDHAVWIPAA